MELQKVILSIILGDYNSCQKTLANLITVDFV